MSNHFNRVPVQLKAFIVKTMPVPLEEADELINDFIDYYRYESLYSYLFEDESKVREKVSEFLKEDGKIIRPGSFYVYCDGVNNSTLFVSDERGVCMLVGVPTNILPKNKETVVALAVSKSMLRIKNPPHYLKEVTDFWIKGFFEENEGLVNKNIIISGFWEYNPETKEITFPENQYIEIGKDYNLLITYERDEFPQEILWLKKHSLGIF